MNVSLLECEPGPLGMTNGSIPDSSITASSYKKVSSFDRLPKYARLGRGRFWMSDDDDPMPWIQVDLISSHNVTGFMTKGHDLSGWVEQIKVQVGNAEENLVFIKDCEGQSKASCWNINILQLY